VFRRGRGGGGGGGGERGGGEILLKMSKKVHEYKTRVKNIVKQAWYNFN